MKTPPLRFSADGKHLENRAFREGRCHDRQDIDSLFYTCSYGNGASHQHRLDKQTYQLDYRCAKETK